MTDAVAEAPTTFIGQAEPAPAPAEPKVEAPKTLGDTLYDAPKGDEPKPAGDPPKEGDAPLKAEESSAELTDEEKAAKEIADKAAAEEAAKITDPTKYELKVPENVTVADDTLTAFKAEAAKLGLTNEAAQSFMDMHIAGLEASHTQFQEGAQTAFNDLRAEWRKECEAMPEFTGAQRKENLAAVAAALDEYGEFTEVDGKKINVTKQMLETTGLGDNPAMVRMVYRMAKALKEGTPTSVGRPIGEKTGPKTLGETFYQEASPRS